MLKRTLAHNSNRSLQHRENYLEADLCRLFPNKSDTRPHAQGMGRRFSPHSENRNATLGSDLFPKLCPSSPGSFFPSVMHLIVCLLMYLNGCRIHCPLVNGHRTTAKATTSSGNHGARAPGDRRRQNRHHSTPEKPGPATMSKHGGREIT